MLISKRNAIKNEKERRVVTRDIILLITGGAIGLVSTCFGIIMSHLLEVRRLKKTWDREDQQKARSVIMDGVKIGQKLLVESRLHEFSDSSKLSCACFPKGTTVRYSDMTDRPIETVVVGDELLSYDIKNRAITRTLVKEAIQLDATVYLFINRRLTITPEHFVYVNGSFKTADSIQLNDELMNEKLSPEHVWSVERRQGRFVVYTCYTVEDFPFFACGVLVETSESKVSLASLVK